MPVGEDHIKSAAVSRGDINISRASAPEVLGIDVPSRSADVEEKLRRVGEVDKFPRSISQTHVIIPSVLNTERVGLFCGKASQIKFHSGVVVILVFNPLWTGGRVLKDGAAVVVLFRSGPISAFRVDVRSDSSTGESRSALGIGGGGNGSLITVINLGEAIVVILGEGNGGNVELPEVIKTFAILGIGNEFVRDSPYKTEEHEDDRH